MSNQVRTDEVQLRVLINGTAAKKELAELSEGSVKLREEQKRLQTALDDVAKKLKAARDAGDKNAIKQLTAEQKQYTNELKATTAALTKNTERQAALRKEIGITGLSLKELKAHANSLRRQIDVMFPDDPRALQLNAELVKVQARIDQVSSAAGRNARAWEVARQGMRLADMSVEELGKELARLRTEQSKLNPRLQADAFAAYGKQIGVVENRIATLRSGMGPLRRMFADLKGQIVGTFAGVGALFAGGAFFQGIRNLFTGSAKLADELANVQKATGLTGAEVRKLNTDLQKIDTRTSGAGLREIAVGLGQIGIEANKVNVESIDKIVVALQDEFGTDGTAITKALSQLRNNLDDIKTGDYGKDVLHIGNALNVLGANGLATADVVTDITNRVGSAARNFGITSGEILGTASIFQELGINVEQGSTAYIKVLQKMAAEPAKFSAVVRDAGMDANQFALDINNNAQRALVTFAQAADKAGGSNSALATIFKELDVDGIGVNTLLSKLSSNAGLLAEKTALATKALTDTTSITDEFRIKNENLAGQLEKLGKEINRLFVNDTVTGWVTSAVTGMRSLVDWVKRTKDEIVFFAKVIATATAAWISYRLTVATIGAVQRAGATIALTYGRTMQFLGIQTRFATTATEGLSKATKLSPWGLVISAVTTVIGLIVAFGDEVKAAAEEQEALNEQMREHVRAMRELAEVEARIHATRERTRANPMAASLEEVREAAQKVGQELDKLSPENFDVFNAIEQGSFKLPELERGSAPTNINEDDYFIDKELLSAASERGKRNIKKVYDAYVQYLRDEKARLDKAEKELEKKLAPPATGGGDEDKELEKARKKLKELEEELKAHRERMLQVALSADERELRQLDVKHQEETAKLKANKLATEQDLILLESEQSRERANLIEEQGQRRIDAHKAVEEKIAQVIKDAKADQPQFEVDSTQRELQLLEQKGQVTFDALHAAYLAAAEQRESQLLQDETATSQYYDALITDATKAHIDTTELETQRTLALLRIRKKYHQDAAAADNEFNKKAKQIYIQDLQNYAQVASQLAGLTQAIANAYAAKTARLEQLADQDGKRTEEETRQIEKAKKRQIDMTLTTLALQTAASIAKGVASAMDMPFPYNLVAAAGVVAEVLTLMATAQTAMDSVNTSTPTGEKGIAIASSGRVITAADGGGVLDGPSHAQDGLKVVNPKTGRVVAEVEGGENMLVMSKAFTQANADLIPAMLEASRRGDRLNAFSAPVDGINHARVVESMRIVHMGVGGLIGTLPDEPSARKKRKPVNGPGGGVGFSPGTGITDPGDGGGGMGEQILAALQKNNVLLEEQNGLVARDIATPRPAQLVTNSDYDETQAKWERLKKSNTFRRA